MDPGADRHGGGPPRSGRLKVTLIGRAENSRAPARALPLVFAEALRLSQPLERVVGFLVELVALPVEEG